MRYDTAGSYEIEYKAVDECGNETVETRKIVVKQEEVEAYAIFDSEDNSLVFAKDKAGYSNGEIVGTKTYYTGIETDQYDTSSEYPWHEHAEEITSIVAVDEIKLATTLLSFNSKGDKEGMDKYSALENVDLTKLDMTSLTTAQDMFGYCGVLKSVALPTMPNVTNFGQMFMYCSELLSVKFGKQTNVETCVRMFGVCSSLTEIDLSSFSIAESGALLFATFSTCSELTTIYAKEDWKYKQIATGLANTFLNCTKLVGGKGTTYDPTNAEGKTGRYARIDNPPDNPGYFTLKE